MPGDQETRSSYPTDKRGRARLWKKEFEAAREWLSDWRDKASDIVSLFLDERQDDTANETHLNFYWANVKTQMALLYGKTPKVSVARRHGDPNNDLARVGALMLERLLNTDIERYDDGYRDALSYVLCDYLIPGFGNARVRYWAEFATNEMPERGEPGTPRYAPAVTKRSKVPGKEEVCTDYVFWHDQLWSPCRTHADKRWHAFMAPMTREQLHARFDSVLTPEKVDNIPLNSTLFGTEESGKKQDHDDPWGRADVWEIWDKERGEVVWYIDGYHSVLDVKKDPLGLDGFWPFPRPLMANVTTTKHIPRADYALAQDLYHDINVAATRVSELEDALRVAGVYDANFSGLSRLLDENTRNELIPVQNYPALAEKGGLDRVISWLPMEQVAASLDRLKEQLSEKQRLLYEVTGWYDIMRGQAPEAGQTATATRAVVRYGSVRVQSIQDEFARYASDLQRLRAEIIIKFFDDQTILQRSGIMDTPDRDLAMPALQALRKDFSRYAIEVKPEAVALSDFAAMKAERTEFMQAFVGLMEGGSRLVAALGPQNSAGVLPLVVEVVKWVMAGYRGGASIEGVLDKLLAQAQPMAQQAAQNPQGAPPDPKLMAVQAKTQGDMMREQVKTQAEAERQQIKTRAEAERQRVQLEYNVQETREEARIQSATRADAAATQMATARATRAARPVAPRRTR